MDPTAGSADAAKVVKKFQDMCKAKGFKCTDIVLPGQPGACDYPERCIFEDLKYFLYYVHRRTSRFTSS
jgi:hypothetical protein